MSILSLRRATHSLSSTKAGVYSAEEEALRITATARRSGGQWGLNGVDGDGGSGKVGNNDSDGDGALSDGYDEVYWSMDDDPLFPWRARLDGVNSVMISTETRRHRVSVDSASYLVWGWQW
jgi:hypothetical protein